MPATFSLSPADRESLQRVVLARFQRHHGRFNSAWFAQVFAWMFVTLAVMTFYTQWQRTPEVAQPYGPVVLFAVLGFLVATLSPWVGQRLYYKYVAATDHWFTKEQSVDVQNGQLVLTSATGTAAVARSAIIDHTDDERNHYLFITGVQVVTVPKAAAAALGVEFTAFLAASPSEA